MSDLIADYDVKLRYKGSNGVIHHLNRKSKKGGENLRKASASIETIGFYQWLESLQIDAIRKLYDLGVYDKLITNLRTHFVDTGGRSGISKKEALQRYKFVYSFLSEEQLKNKRETFDNFKEKDIGVVKNE